MAEEHDGMELGEPSEEYREFRRMMDAADRQDLPRMVERLTEKIKANPGDTESLLLRGLVYRGLGEMEQAVRDFGAAVELEPNSPLTNVVTRRLARREVRTWCGPRRRTWAPVGSPVGPPDASPRAMPAAGIVSRSIQRRHPRIPGRSAAWCR